MRAVNLLPREHQIRTSATSWHRFVSPSPVVGAAAGAVVVLATLGALFVTTGGKVDEKQRQVTELREEQARAAAERARVDTPARQQREAAVATAVAQRLAWDVMLTRLAHVVPNSIQLNTLAAGVPGAAGAAAAPAPAGGAPVTDFTVTGVARSHRDVARLLTRLRLVPGLVDPQLASSTKGEGEGGRPMVQFSISAGIDPAEVRA
jgi:Tfp pilus assembly protein PilN